MPWVNPTARLPVSTASVTPPSSASVRAISAADAT